MAWLTATDLRTAAGSTLAYDQAKFERAAAIACREVERMFGKILIQNITERVTGGGEELFLDDRPTELVSITTRPGAVALTVADFDFDDQLLFRKDGGWIADDLTVVYKAGYFTGEAGDTDPPDWAMSAALLIGHQFLRVSKRFSVTDDATVGVGFLIPDAVKDIGRDFRLAKGVGF